MIPRAAADETNPTESRNRETAPIYVALTGNPNCGKTTLFNALTGLRAKSVAAHLYFQCRQNTKVRKQAKMCTSTRSAL